MYTALWFVNLEKNKVGVQAEKVKCLDSLSFSSLGTGGKSGGEDTCVPSRAWFLNSGTVDILGR